VAQLGHHQTAPSSIAVHQALHLSLLLVSSH
jgi:hypothetical protein